MPYIMVCAVVFLLAYLVNITYLSVFYHRGLTHGALQIRPWMKKFVVVTGTWMTGLDPKVWCCMHRAHHLHSDTEKDPHSPVNVGVWGVMLAQKNAYSDTTWQLIRKEEPATSIVQDLDFDVNWLSRSGYFLLPYGIHAVVALLLAWALGGWMIAPCYFFGMMSHPIQGWMVNSFGHRFGYRNFALADNSRNNTLVSWMVLGEGFQNNHHQAPQSPKFSVKWYEVDFGYLVCRVARAFRLIDLKV